jgi:hypothetical protein
VIDGDGVLVAVTRDEAPALLRALIQKDIAIIEARWTGGGLEKFYLEQTSQLEQGAPHAG